MGSPKEQDLCMHGLRNAAGFVQAKLAGRLKTRFTPIIAFVLDKGVKNSIEISRLINEALHQGAPPEPAAEDADQSSPSADGPAEEVPGI
jgi:ribosome-binding factor A